MSLKNKIWFALAVCLLISFPHNVHAEEKSKEQISQVLNQADDLIQKKQYGRALVLLEGAHKLSPANPTVKRKLLVAYQKYGDELSKQGLIQQALKTLEKAKAVAEEGFDEKNPETDRESRSDGKDVLDPEMVHIKNYVTSDKNDAADQAIADENARVLFLQAVDSYKKKQYGLARGLLTEGLQYNDKSAIVYELLGDIEYYSQNLKNAKDAYIKSYAINSNQRVGDKLKKLTDEEKLEHQLSEYLDEHFIIRYNRREQLEGAEIREYLRESYKTITRDFGYFLNYKTVVILYDQAEYRKVLEVPHWSGALFDGKIRIPFYEANMNKKKLPRLIQHELTHVFVTDLSAGHAPVWLHEGLAEYEENKIVPIDTRLFRTALGKNSILSAAELMQGLSQNADQIKASLFYVESFLLTEDLVEKRRLPGIKQILTEMAKDMPFPDAFEKVCGVSFDEYFRKWQATEKDKLKPSPS